MLSSAGGLAHGLWSLATDPIQVSKDLVTGVHACLDYLREHSKGEIIQDLVPELQTLVREWDTLNHLERGKIAGFVIGKYGVDIFAGAGAAKAMKAYRNLKRANNLLTFEAAALSSKNSTQIIAQSIKTVDIRSQTLKSANLKIQADKQGKHILGHRNFEPELKRSIFEHPDPQRLVNEHAGSGKRLNSYPPGQAGYKELVNFHEHIGYNYNPNKMITRPTTWGTIHYANDGVHIVPAFPKD